MNSDMSQYGAKPLPEKVDTSQRDFIKGLVDDISRHTGRDTIGWAEFQARHAHMSRRYARQRRAHMLRRARAACPGR